MLKRTEILIADDDPAQRMVIRIYLEEEGYQVVEAEDGYTALKRLGDNPHLRLLIVDLEMPALNGFDLIREVRAKEARYNYIIVLTASEEDESMIRALTLGADDFLIKPVRRQELILRLQGGLRLLRLESHEELIFSMAKLADFHSRETGFHLERVRNYTRLLCHELVRNHPRTGMTLNLSEEIASVSPLHDLGKVAIADSILHKAGKLTEEEWEIMKAHTNIGGNILKDIYDRTGAPYLHLAYEVAMFHHEKWDGTGYPQALKERSIPISARIVALADVYDAISSERSYKNAASHEECRTYILSQNGAHFDPMLVEAFLNVEAEWLKIRQEFQDD